MKNKTAKNITTIIIILAILIGLLYLGLALTR